MIGVTGGKAGAAAGGVLQAVTKANIATTIARQE